MDMIIVTGMSGSGKGTAFKMLEDRGYFCVDNLPVKLLDRFLDLMNTAEGAKDKIALGIDIRGGENIDSMLETLEQLFGKHRMFKMLYMDASDECLIRRYKESRHVHPLYETAGSLEEAIHLERKKLEPVRKRADYVIDTSFLLTRELQNRLKDIFENHGSFKNLNVTVMTFGFKNGVPQEADFVFDVRFLPNPHYDPVLRPHTGNEKIIQDYVLNNPEAEEFLDKLFAMFRFLIPQFMKAEKNQLVIAVGCTGGKHRSVSVGNRLYEALKEDTSYGCNLIHRDLNRNRS